MWTSVRVMPFETLFSEAIDEVKLSVEKYSGKECICSLCIEDIENGTDIYRLKCNHIFHARKCLEDKGIIDWINKHNTCPYCRAEIADMNGLDEDNIQCVMAQADASRENAIRALRQHGNIVDAILALTP
jgi:Ring finger domain